MRDRSKALNPAASRTYDVCVIGGGATGAGCALDAQLRGLSTVLVEAGDFASRTSSASTKMVHGGIRYLQAAATGFDLRQYRLVTHALGERTLMLRNAPHLAHRMEFLVPCFGWAETLYYGAGLKLYDWVAGRASLASSRMLSRAEALRRLGAVQSRRLSGAVSYADGQFDDARYALALIRTFVRHGGDAFNYARAMAFEKDTRGRIATVAVEDGISGSSYVIRARAFVNATGPFSDALRHLACTSEAPRIRPSKGIHLLFPLPSGWANDAMVVPKTEDGRVVFAIPYQGRLLVGTTDDEAAPGDEMIVTHREADYLLRQINPYLAAPLSSEEIVSAFAGLRPLVQAAGAAKTSALIRDDEVVYDGESGLISILGGKWTTYRSMAEKTIDRVQNYLGMEAGGCRTHDCPLIGSENYHAGLWHVLSRDHVLPAETALHLASKYGTTAWEVMGLLSNEPALARPLVEGAPQIRAEVVYAVRNEFALTLEDVLLRRTGLELFSWRMAVEAAPEAAALMARELRWTPSERVQAVSGYIARISRLLASIGQNCDSTNDLLRLNLNEFSV